MKVLPRVGTEMALHVLVFNLTREHRGVQSFMAGYEGIVAAETSGLICRSQKE
jgi:hypothetical protein